MRTHLFFLTLSWLGQIKLVQESMIPISQTMCRHLCDKESNIKQNNSSVALKVFRN